MLTDARRIVADLESLRARAKSIKQGVEAQITLAVSVMVPSDAVVASLRAFRERFPAVSVNLTVGELGMVIDLVVSGRADIAVSGALLRQDDRVVAEKIGQSFMLPVAAADYPLGQIRRPSMIADVRGGADRRHGHLWRDKGARFQRPFLQDVARRRHRHEVPAHQGRSRMGRAAGGVGPRGSRGRQARRLEARCL